MGAAKNTLHLITLDEPSQSSFLKEDCSPCMMPGGMAFQSMMVLGQKLYLYTSVDVLIGIYHIPVHDSSRPEAVFVYVRRCTDWDISYSSP